MKNNLKLLFVSLGCDKNLVDTEFMLGMLRDDGIEMTDDEQEADIIIVNTCCFINDAKEESINTILEMAELKKEARLKSLIVTGCLAQRYKEEIVKEIPEVDAILGTNSYEDIVNAVHQSLEGKHYENFKTLEGLPTLHTKRSVTTGGHFAYLKIAEGCNKRCTYCIIPYIRGNYRSVPMEDLIEQAKELVAAGACRRRHPRRAGRAGQEGPAGPRCPHRHRQDPRREHQGRSHPERQGHPSHR